MRGRGAIFPVGFAVFFGVMNGYSIFQPLVVEDRLKTLQERGAKEAIPLTSPLQVKSEAVQAANMNERAAKKELNEKSKPAA